MELSPSAPHVEFSLESEDEVHIALSAHPNIKDKSTHEVILGARSNQMSSIINVDSGKKEEFMTPGIISATARRRFWIRWTNSTILVGLGPLHSGVLMRYVENGVLHPVRGVAVSSNGSEARWTFQAHTGTSSFHGPRTYVWGCG